MSDLKKKKKSDFLRKSLIEQITWYEELKRLSVQEYAKTE